MIFRGFFFSSSLSSFSLVSLCCRALTGVSHCLKVPRRGCLCFRLFRTIFLILDPTFSAYPLLSATISFSTSTSFLPLSFESSPFPALVYPQTRLLHHTLSRRLRLYLLFIPHTHTSRKDQEYCRVSGREYSKRAGTKWVYQRNGLYPLPPRDHQISLPSCLSSNPLTYSIGTSPVPLSLSSIASFPFSTAELLSLSLVLVLSPTGAGIGWRSRSFPPIDLMRSPTLGADPYLPRGLIESFLRVFKHFTLKIPRGKVRVFLKKTLVVKIKKSPGGKFKKTWGANLKKAWGVFLWVFFEKTPRFLSQFDQN